MAHCNSVWSIEVSIINSVVLYEALAFHFPEADSVYVSSQLNSGRFPHLSLTQEKEAEKNPKDYQRHKVRKLCAVPGQLDFKLNKTAFSIYSTRKVNIQRFPTYTVLSKSIEAKLSWLLSKWINFGSKHYWLSRDCGWKRYVKKLPAGVYRWLFFKLWASVECEFVRGTEKLKKKLQCCYKINAFLLQHLRMLSEIFCPTVNTIENCICNKAVWKWEFLLWRLSGLQIFANYSATKNIMQKLRLPRELCVCEDTQRKAINK